MKKYCLLSIVIVIAIFLLAYRPTLFNFFIGDDYWSLAWANEAIQHPGLLLEEYVKSWQTRTGHTVTPCGIIFFRPLFGTVMFLEYKLFGMNGLYFRLVNITAEVLAGFLLGLIIISLDKKLIDKAKLSSEQLSTWALFSLSFFLLYPLHSEPVNYIADILDPLLVLFSLFSLWSYIRWRKTANKGFLTLSIIGAILAFLTKETALALPPTICTYELLLRQNTAPTTTNSLKNYIKILRHSLIATLPYWLILIPYFGWRKIILGDFIAGYPNELCHPTIEGWLRGLRDIFVPINTSIIGTHNFTFKIWHLILFIAISINAYVIFKTNKNGRKILSFFMIWLLLALAPVYRIFPVLMSCGSGSRFAYLATAPFCVLWTYGLAMSCFNNRFRHLFRLIALATLVITAALLYSNNQVWAKAGNWTNKVTQELLSYCQKITDNHPIYVTRLPVFYKNIDSIGPLNRITRKPMINRDIDNCARLDYSDQYISLGFLKQALANNHLQAHLVYWDSSAETLRPVSVSPQPKMFTKKWRGNDLKQVIRISSLPLMPTSESRWMQDGTFELLSHAPHTTFTAIELKLPKINCWYTDYVILKAQFVHNKDFSVFGKSELRFTNDIAKDYSKEYQACDSCSSAVSATREMQEIIFPMRNLAAWNLGGTCSSVRIILPIEQCIKISEVSIPMNEKLIPVVYLKQVVSDPPGQIQINNNSLYIQNIKYDATFISGSQKVILEIIPVSQSFENINTKDGNKIFLLKKESDSLAGQFILNRADFPSTAAFYRARIRLLDKVGNRVALPSDIFFIYIPS